MIVNHLPVHSALKLIIHSVFVDWLGAAPDCQPIADIPPCKLPAEKFCGYSA